MLNNFILFQVLQRIDDTTNSPEISRQITFLIDYIDSYKNSVPKQRQLSADSIN